MEEKKGITLIEAAIVGIILLIGLGVVIPSVFRARMAKFENAAASSLKTLNGMMATYKKKGYYGQGRRYPHGNAPAYLNDGKFCGMYYSLNGAGEAVTLIGAAEAAADLRADGDTDMQEDTGDFIPTIAITTIIPQPIVQFSCRAKFGYWYGLFMSMDGPGTAGYPYDLTNARWHYGMQATPAHYGATGESTFIINEAGLVYTLDRSKTGYMPLFPTVNPTIKGWEIAP